MSRCQTSRVFGEHDVVSWMSFAAAFPLSRFRQARITLAAPSLTSHRLASRPRPEELPVTMTVRSLKERVGIGGV